MPPTEHIFFYLEVLRCRRELAGLGLEFGRQRLQLAQTLRRIPARLVRSEKEEEKEGEKKKSTYKTPLFTTENATSTRLYQGIPEHILRGNNI